MRIYLDMDGVLCDFVSASFAAHGRTYTDGDVVDWHYYREWGLDDEAFWDVINARGAAFWANLKPYGWMDELLTAVRGVDPEFRVCSTPSRHPSSLYGKAQWLGEHLSEIGPERVFFTASKADLAAPGRMLIDDSDANVAAWKAAGGEGFLWSQPWNRHSVRGGDIDDIMALGAVKPAPNTEPEADYE